MTKFSYWHHIQSQWTWLPPVHHVDLSGQTVVVTGSNIGLGLETVKHLARMNPENIILAVRSTSKGEAVIPGELDVQQAIRQVMSLTNLQRSGMSPDIPATLGS
jgi:NAD(P)-dependent dehydrogenase (short-subunit alcohol dehydrogenase family)